MPSSAFPCFLLLLLVIVVHGWSEGGASTYQSELLYFNAAEHRRSRQGFSSLASPANTPAPPPTCGFHGRVSGSSCQCDSDAVLGYWTGSKCDACARGWAGSSCTIECYGGSCNRCSSHGTCNEGTSGDGTCTCYSNRNTGFWGGQNCSSCATNYFGANCQEACPGIDLSGIVCFGRGTCTTTKAGTGTCICNAGFGADSGCFDCDDSHWGPNCAYTCDGYIAATKQACNGHGVCFNGTSGNGTCICQTYYGSTGCAKLCPTPPTAHFPCNPPHGVCLDGAENEATCKCFGNFAAPACGACIANVTGSNCDLPCPSSVGTQHDPNLPVCSNNGVCAFIGVTSLQGSYTEYAQCNCTPGYTDVSCSTACPGNPPCSGHGDCVSSSCQCFSGWSGSVCDSCSSYNLSTACDTACPVGTNGKVCSDNGKCFNGYCFCDESKSTSYCGNDCTLAVINNLGITCSSGATLRRYCPSPGTYGSDCTRLCPGRTEVGGAVTVCSGNGYCDSGVAGSGTCTCLPGYGSSTCAVQCPSSALGVCSGAGRGRCTTPADAVLTAACSCLTGFAGTDCSITCPQVANQVCGGHGLCNVSLATKTASCICSAGWTGVTCNVPCACDSSHGSCNQTACADYFSFQTCSICVCNPNFVGLCDVCAQGKQGTDCSGECANGNTVGKKCQCFGNYSLPSCTKKCPMNGTTLCSGHGYCAWGADQSGVCTCDNNYYGDDCSVYCTPSLCTQLLHAQCNSVTGACECQDDFAGHWDTDPSALLGCTKCAELYWGPTCIEDCQCNGNGVCDQETGECTCHDSDTAGHYAGTFCQSCATGYIGANCDRQNVAITRLNRFNDPAVLYSTSSLTTPSPTVLFLHADTELLYAGSMPVYTLNISGGQLVYQRQPSNTTNGVARAEVINVYSALGINYFLVQTSDSSAAAIWRFPVGEDPDFTSPSGASASIPNPVHLTTSAAGSVLGTTQFTVVASAFFLTTVPVLGVVASRRTSDGTLSNGGYLVRIDLKQAFNADPNVRQSAYTEKSLDNAFIAHDMDASVISVTGGGVQERFAVAGEQTAKGWSILYLSFVSAFQTALGQQYLEGTVDCWPLTVPATTCSICAVATKVKIFGDAIVATMAVRNDTTGDNSTSMVIFRTIDSFITDSAASSVIVYGKVQGTCVPARYNPTTGYFVEVGTSNVQPDTPSVLVEYAASDIAGSTAGAMAIDTAEVPALFVSLDTSSAPSQVLKLLLTLGNFSVTGTEDLNYVAVASSSNVTIPERIATLAVDADHRLLYGLITGVDYLRITTFLLYEVRSITPDIADSRGGTLITITGLGFTSTTGRTFETTCQFAGATPVFATSVNFRKVVCATPLVEAITTSLSCTGGLVAVSLYNDTWFTENQVYLRRIQAPRITAVNPTYGSRKGGQRLTVIGSGLVASATALCTFWSSNPRSREIHSSALIFDTPNTAYCIQPASVNASVPPSYLNVTIDGQLYCPFGPVSYNVVGQATGLYVTPQTKSVAANVSSVDMSVSVIDQENHFLNELDTQVRTTWISANVTIGTCDTVLFSWRTEDDGYPWPPCRNNTFDLLLNQITMTQGTGTFRNVYVINPRAAQTRITFATVNSVDGALWTTSTIVTIVEGASHALKIQNYVEIQGKAIVDGQPFSPNPEIIVIDALANVLTVVPTTLAVKCTTYYILHSDNSTVFGPAYTNQPRSDTNVFRFEQIFFRYIHGATHYANFSAILASDLKTPSGELGTQTPGLITQLCPNPATSYKLQNSGLCLSCPSVGAICNGSEYIEVIPGYWRAQNTTTAIYACPGGVGNCPGTQAAAGAPCGQGYTGPMCTVCADGYGRDGQTSCGKCPPTSSSILIVIGGGFLFIALLLVWTIATLRTGTVTDVSVIFRTVVNHLQATGKLGEFGQQWGPVLQQVYSAQNTASSPSVSGVAALDCLLHSAGYNYTAMFYGYMALPLLSLFMALLVFVVVRLLKLEPVLSDELQEEIEKDIASLGKNTKLAVLRVRYPFYMVATTTACVNMFAMYQTLITESTAVLNCISVISEVPAGTPGAVACTGDPTSFCVTNRYTAVDMSIPCNSNGQNNMWTVAMMFAFVYGFGVPMAFMFSYSLLTARTGRPALTRTMFLFLIGGYRPEYWWWQITIMVRKLLLVLTASFIDDPKLQLYCGMWIMGLCLISQLRLAPNEKETFNIVEAMSLAIITATLNLSLIYYWPGISDTGKLVVTVILVIITLCALLIFGYFLIKPVKEMVHEIATVAKDKVTEMRETADPTEKSAPRYVAHRVLFDDSSDDEAADMLKSGPRTSLQIKSGPRTLTRGPRFAEFEEKETAHLFGRTQAGPAAPNFDDEDF